MASTEIDLQPTLTSERVVIRPIQGLDFAALFAAAADPDIWQQHPAPDRYKESVFRTYFDDAIASNAAFVFVDPTTEAIFGSSRYHAYDAGTREIEIGWTFLSRRYWGGDYNREIKRLMLDHAFQFASAVIFWVGQTNVRSRRAMEKVGGVLRDGTFTRAATGNAAHVIYEIRRP